MTSNAELARLCEDYWDFLLDMSPFQAQAVGDTRHYGELARDSIADYAERNERAHMFLQRLEAIEPDTLKPPGRETFLLLQRELKNIVTSFCYDQHLRPQLMPFTPDAQLAFSLNQSAIFSVKDGQEHVLKLRRIPQALSDIIERLREGVSAGYRVQRVLIERIALSAESQLRLPVDETQWFKALSSKSDENYADIRRDARTVIKEMVNPALENWLLFLRGEYERAATDTLALTAQPDGDAYYRYLVKAETLSDLSPEEIHELGKADVARIQAEMEAVAAEAGYPDDLQGLRRHLNSDKRFIADSADDLKQKIETLSKRIDRKIPEFFGRLPRTTYGVESIPLAASAALPPAYAQPNPANGTASGIHWITSLPERCPTYMHIPLALHEAWPGHLMHIGLLQEIDDLPAFRRHGAMNYNAYLEGWALYCERLGHDMGFYDDPTDLYGRLDTEMWRATRLVVDTGIHLFAWTRQQAIDYMADNVCLPLATIEAEVDRYIGFPAQALAYKVGEFKFRELRARAETALGEDFSLRDFHDELINCGPVTLTLLDDHIQNWLNTVTEK